jgi:hypothetical protein
MTKQGIPKSATVADSLDVHSDIWSSTWSGGWGAGLEVCEVGLRTKVNPTGGQSCESVSTADSVKDNHSRGMNKVRGRMIWVPTIEVVLAMMKRC